MSLYLINTENDMQELNIDVIYVIKSLICIIIIINLKHNVYVQRKIEKSITNMLNNILKVKVIY